MVQHMKQTHGIERVEKEGAHRAGGRGRGRSEGDEERDEAEDDEEATALFP